jgi:hypothetical protein
LNAGSLLYRCVRRVLDSEVVERTISADQLSLRSDDVSASSRDVAVAEVLRGSPEMPGSELKLLGDSFVVTSRGSSPRPSSVVVVFHSVSVGTEKHPETSTESPHRKHPRTPALRRYRTSTDAVRSSSRLGKPAKNGIPVEW